MQRKRVKLLHGNEAEVYFDKPLLVNYSFYRKVSVWGGERQLQGVVESFEFIKIRISNLVNLG